MVKNARYQAHSAGSDAGKRRGPPTRAERAPGRVRSLQSRLHPRGPGHAEDQAWGERERRAGRPPCAAGRRAARRLRQTLLFQTPLFQAGSPHGWPGPAGLGKRLERVWVPRPGPFPSQEGTAGPQAARAAAGGGEGGVSQNLPRESPQRQRDLTAAQHV